MRKSSLLLVSGLVGLLGLSEANAQVVISPSATTLGGVPVLPEGLPATDKLIFVDVSAGVVRQLTIGSGIVITGTQIDVAGAGLGDVTGPGSALDGNFVCFNGITGKVVKDCVLSPLSFLVSGTTSTQNISGGDLYLQDDTSPSNFLKITVLDNLDATRTLSINVGNADRSLTLTATNTLIGGTNTGDVTLAGTPDYITISGQVITRAAVNLSGSHVTGNLPVTNLNSGTNASAATAWFGDGTWKSISGTGDVVGPASSTDNNLVSFDSTTGKLIKDSTVTISVAAPRTLTISANATIGGTNSGDVTLAGSPDYITVSGQVITRALINLGTHVTSDLPFANLTQGSALSVLGVTGNATADFASIAAGSDNQVLRRSGTSLAFGAVNLASSSAVTGNLSVNNLNSGTSASSLTFWNGSGAWLAAVIGAGSSTDRAIATYNSTTGNLLRDNPSVTIDASSNLTTTGVITGLRFKGAFNTLSTETTLGAHYRIHCDTSGAERTLTLPAVSGTTGTEYTIIKTGANSCIIDGNSAEEVNGELNYTLVESYAAITVTSTGSEWLVTSTAVPGIVDPGANILWGWQESTNTTIPYTVAGCTLSGGELSCSGAGDVTAASTFGTDNVIIRSDGTNKGVQSTGITIDNSNVVTGMKYDTAGTGNDFSSYSEYILPAGVCQGSTASLGFSTPTSGAVTVACVTGTNTQKAVVQFSNTGTTSLQHVIQLPTGFTGVLDLKGKWRTAATSGNLILQIQTSCIADGETSDPSWNTASESSADAAKGTTLQENDITISSVTVTGCLANEKMNFKILRDSAHASDTLADTAEFFNFVLVAYWTR